MSDIAKIGVIVLVAGIAVFALVNDRKSEAMMPWDKTTGSFTTADGILVEDVRSDEAPAFERRYTIKLDERATMRVSVKTFLGKRWPDGELKQPDGKWVRFDPRDIADKIIDRTLVPLVEKACATVIAEDAKYAKHFPDVWTDKDGNTWQRRP